MQHLDLTDEETAALLRELDEIIENDRYLPSSRIQTLKAIRAKIEPYAVRRPLSPREGDARTYAKSNSPTTTSAADLVCSVFWSD
jgi:hypothetical protein